jgi:hypothetical protein
VQEDALGGEKITTVWSKPGQVQGTYGKDSSHDIVTLKTKLNDCHPPELTNTGVGGKGGKCVHSKIVQELKLQDRQAIVADACTW